MQLPAVAIVSRDVGVAYAMQLDLAEPRSSLLSCRNLGWLTAAVLHEAVVWNCMGRRIAAAHELR